MAATQNQTRGAAWDAAALTGHVRVLLQIDVDGFDAQWSPASGSSSAVRRTSGRAEVGMLGHLQRCVSALPACGVQRPDELRKRVFRSYRRRRRS